MIAYLLEKYKKDIPKHVNVAVTDLETAIDWCEDKEERTFEQIIVSDVLNVDQIEMITKENYEENE